MDQDAGSVLSPEDAAARDAQLAAYLPYDVVEEPLPHALEGYVRTLVAQHETTFNIKTGAGHIHYDLLAHWPIMVGWEDQTESLCHYLTELAYPLAAQLYARAVEITVRISAQPLAPLGEAEALATYIALDAEHGMARHVFLAPHHAPLLSAITVPAGVSLLCRPLHYHYHQLHDDWWHRPRHGASNLPIRVNRNADPLEDPNEAPFIQIPQPIANSLVPPGGTITTYPSSTQKLAAWGHDFVQAVEVTAAALVPNLILPRSTAFHGATYAEHKAARAAQPKPAVQASFAGLDTKVGRTNPAVAMVSLAGAEAPSLKAMQLPSSKAEAQSSLKHMEQVAARMETLRHVQASVEPALAATFVRSDVPVRPAMMPAAEGLAVAATAAKIAAVMTTPPPAAASTAPTLRAQPLSGIQQPALQKSLQQSSPQTIEPALQVPAKEQTVAPQRDQPSTSPARGDATQSPQLSEPQRGSEVSRTESPQQAEATTAASSQDQPQSTATQKTTEPEISSFDKEGQPEQAPPEKQPTEPSRADQKPSQPTQTDDQPSLAQSDKPAQVQGQGQGQAQGQVKKQPQPEASPQTHGVQPSVHQEEVLRSEVSAKDHSIRQQDGFQPPVKEPDISRLHDQQVTQDRGQSHPHPKYYDVEQRLQRAVHETTDHALRQAGHKTATLMPKASPETFSHRAPHAQPTGLQAAIHNRVQQMPRPTPIVAPRHAVNFLSKLTPFM